MTTLVIEREKWLRGDMEVSRLLNSAGKMCCLGFFGCSLGLTADEIAPHRTPGSHVRRNTSRDVWPTWLLRDDGYASIDGSDLMGINDDGSITDAERETRIAAIFAKHGVTVVFK